VGGGGGGTRMFAEKRSLGLCKEESRRGNREQKGYLGKISITCFWKEKQKAERHLGERIGGKKCSEKREQSSRERRVYVFIKERALDVRKDEENNKRGELKKSACPSGDCCSLKRLECIYEEKGGEVEKMRRESEWSRRKQCDGKEHHHQRKEHVPSPPALGGGGEREKIGKGGAGSCRIALGRMLEGSCVKVVRKARGDVSSEPYSRLHKREKKKCSLRGKGSIRGRENCRKTGPDLGLGPSSLGGTD